MDGFIKLTGVSILNHLQKTFLSRIYYRGINSNEGH
ncbi:MAG: hypothetical protein BWX51_01508 [Bacteroidetes bacterium ADurb.Bin012]|nr:MAG: hypothetical protein BWX51_01508 [Bacteroidetes bacterium ADurb.Bin012]